MVAGSALLASYRRRYLFGKYYHGLFLEKIRNIHIVQNFDVRAISTIN